MPGGYRRGGYGNRVVITHARVSEDDPGPMPDWMPDDVIPGSKWMIGPHNMWHLVPPDLQPVEGQPSDFVTPDGESSFTPPKIPVPRIVATLGTLAFVAGGIFLIVKLLSGGGEPAAPPAAATPVVVTTAATTAPTPALSVPTTPAPTVVDTRPTQVSGSDVEATTTATPTTTLSPIMIAPPPDRIAPGFICESWPIERKRGMIKQFCPMVKFFGNTDSLGPKMVGS